MWASVKGAVVRGYRTRTLRKWNDFGNRSAHPLGSDVSMHFAFSNIDDCAVISLRASAADGRARDLPAGALGFHPRGAGPICKLWCVEPPNHVPHIKLPFAIDIVFAGRKTKLLLLLSP